MKLNNPIQVRNSLNDQKRIDIDLGIKLANRVDDVRKNLNEEEIKYQKFHKETIKQIQLDIDNKIKEKEILNSEISSLAKEKEKLLEPLDREWEKLKKEKLDLKIQQEDLGKTSQTLLKSIQNNESKYEWNKMEARRIQNLDESTKTLFNKAQKAEIEAKLILEQAKETSKGLVEPLKQKEKEIEEREEAVRVYKQTLELKEIEIQEKEKEIINEKIRLADQRGVLERALARANIKI